MGDPGHILPTRLGKAWSFAGSVDVSSSCWVIALSTAELQLHIFPFQLLSLEYSPKNTLDSLPCCQRE